MYNYPCKIDEIIRDKERVDFESARVPRVGDRWQRHRKGGLERAPRSGGDF